MKKLTVQEPPLQTKRKTIQRGAYWFGIMGRLSLLYGVVSALALFATVLFTLYLRQQGVDTIPEIQAMIKDTPVSGAISAMIYGWLFLLGRDAFVAIDLLIAEMNEVV